MFQNVYLVNYLLAALLQANMAEETMKNLNLSVTVLSDIMQLKY